MKRFYSILPLLLLGFGAGVVNGLLGAGGGILLVSGLSRLLASARRDAHIPFAAAIAVMLPLSLFSAYRYKRLGHLLTADFAPLLLPAALGGLLGGVLLHRFSPRSLKILFAAVVLASGVIMVVR